ncbi:probable serine/threonine-protein kinase ndrD [Oppia nitens]|uniref:probable serine/threonine-protein kinase ndrD n=1 Tax=Oppia nitens TaxID=1686743 RepID=UPI0023DB8280|nr:probable serine/threonine-protein kinase ndrD [Oppia nitens]
MAQECSNSNSGIIAIDGSSGGDDITSTSSPIGQPSTTAFIISFDDDLEEDNSQSSTHKKMLNIKDSIRKFAPPRPDSIEKPRPVKNSHKSSGSGGGSVGDGDTSSTSPKQLVGVSGRRQLSSPSSGGNNQSATKNNNNNNSTVRKQLPTHLVEPISTGHLSDSAAYLINRMLSYAPKDISGRSTKLRSTNHNNHNNHNTTNSVQKEVVMSKSWGIATGDTDSGVPDMDNKSVRSETGTYTVGLDQEEVEDDNDDNDRSIEVETARQQIDHVFGISDDNITVSLNSSLASSLNSPTVLKNIDENLRTKQCRGGGGGGGSGGERGGGGGGRRQSFDAMTTTTTTTNNNNNNLNSNNNNSKKPIVINDALIDYNQQQLNNLTITRTKRRVPTVEEMLHQNNNNNNNSNNFDITTNSSAALSDSRRGSSTATTATTTTTSSTVKNNISVVNNNPNNKSSLLASYDSKNDLSKISNNTNNTNNFNDNYSNNYNTGNQKVLPLPSASNNQPTSHSAPSTPRSPFLQRKLIALKSAKQGKQHRQQLKTTTTADHRKNSWTKSYAEDVDDCQSYNSDDDSTDLSHRSYTSCKNDVARDDDDGCGDNTATTTSSDIGGYSQRFNRAFALRRARLGIDTPASAAAPGVPVNRSASSASATAAAHSRQSSTPHKPTATAAPNGGSFSRSDGGRFSLRVAKNNFNDRLRKTQNHQQLNRISSKENVSHHHQQRPSVQRKGSDSASSVKSSSVISPRLSSSNSRQSYAYSDTDRNTINNNNHYNNSHRGNSQWSTSLRQDIHRSTSSHHQQQQQRNGGDSHHQQQQQLINNSSNKLSPILPQRGGVGESVRRDSLPGCLPPVTDRRGVAPVAKYQPHQQYLNGSHSETPNHYHHYQQQSNPITTTTTIHSKPPISSQLRTKPVLELTALDGLVISAINQLSYKLRTNMLAMLDSQRSRLEDNCEARVVIDEIMPQLLMTTSPERSPYDRELSVSRDLSTVLKNLKKLEQSYDVLKLMLDNNSSSNITTTSTTTTTKQQQQKQPPSRRPVNPNQFFVVDV